MKDTLETDRESSTKTRLLWVAFAVVGLCTCAVLLGLILVFFLAVRHEQQRAEQERVEAELARQVPAEEESRAYDAQQQRKRVEETNTKEVLQAKQDAEDRAKVKQAWGEAVEDERKEVRRLEMLKDMPAANPNVNSVRQSEIQLQQSRVDQVRDRIKSLEDASQRR